MMRSLIVKRSIIIAGQKTSVSLENEFWEELKKIASTRNRPVSHLIADIEDGKQGNLSSAIRLFVLDDVQKRKN
jgi:predicted DNA-binding ribbon-helix-helix protein